MTQIFRSIDPWAIACVAYVVAVVGTFLPVLRAVLRKVQLDGKGPDFDRATHFSDQTKERLKQHYERLRGTLVFWKNKAAVYKSIHHYIVFWTIPSAILIPILIQYIEAGNLSKLMLTLVAAHTALLLAFHRGVKVEENFQAFRHGESEFYDLYRRVLDSPLLLGNTEEEQVAAYFKEVETIRRFVRNAETNNLATLEEARSKFEARDRHQKHTDA